MKNKKHRNNDIKNKTKNTADYIEIHREKLPSNNIMYYH